MGTPTGDSPKKLDKKAKTILADLGDIAGDAICSQIHDANVEMVRVGDDAGVAIRVEVGAGKEILIYGTLGEASSLASELLCALLKHNYDSGIEIIIDGIHSLKPVQRQAVATELQKLCESLAPSEAIATHAADKRALAKGGKA